MKYMGSKARFAKEIISVMMPGHDPSKPYVEPFAGGMNMIASVNAPIRIANDFHEPLISMWKEIANGWMVPVSVTREFYEECRRGEHPPHVVGYVGFNCSYSGKWFGGYAGVTNTRGGGS